MISPNLVNEWGNQLLGVNLVYREGQLGCPNPSANLIGVYQAYDFFSIGYALLLFKSAR